jgi:NAD(P)-binding Rossmann-like domain
VEALGVISRRDFIAMLLGAPLAASWACRGEGRLATPPGELIDTGAERGHRWLRERERAAAPSAWERHRVVVVGGGVAGLAAAWALRRSGVDDVVVLELDEQLGGTARAGKSATTAYPWGAHYIVAPAPAQHELTSLLTEMGAIEGYGRDGAPIVDEALRCREPEERIFYRGRWYEGLYLRAGASEEDLRQLAAFQAEIDRWASWRDDGGRRAFTIPVSHCSTDERVVALDRQSFAAWLVERKLTSERLRWLCDYACRDDYGLLAEHTSAWAGLFYFASRQLAAGVEPQPVITWPEGNYALVSHLAGAAAVRRSALVTDVAPSDGGIRVTMQGEAGPAGILAERVIVAVPRFLARRIVAPLREAAAGAGAGDASGGAGSSPADYGAWAVANLHLRQRPSEARGAQRAWDNVIYRSKSLGYVTATHQRGREHGPTVITWYYPFTDGDAASARRSIAGAGQREWAELALADLSRAHPDLREITERIDVAFWGHGMIRPKVGAIWHPSRAADAQAHGGIHFAHTDLSGLALFEEAFDHGNRAAREVMASLSRGA